MRELLGDPTWGPREVVERIQRHDGFPGDDHPRLPQWAPVIHLGTCQAHSDNRHVFFSTGREVYTVTWDTAVLVVYGTSHLRAHAVCVRAIELFGLAQRFMIVDVFLRAAGR